MKRYLIISAMLLAALQISAQSNNRSRTTGESAGSARQSETTRSANSEQATERKSTSRERRAVSAPTTSNRETTATPSRSQERTRVTSSGNTNQPVRKAGTPATVNQSTDRRVNTAPSGTVNVNRSPARTAPERKTAPANSSPQRVDGSRTNQGSAVRSAQSVRGNEYSPRTAPRYEQARRTYETPARKTVVRTTHHTSYVYRPIEYRRVHYPYHAPAHVSIYWSVPMYRYYRTIYPEFNLWYYPVGYRIHTVSAYDAGMYIGELARIYGRVENVWHSRSTNEYYLYFGGPYPYQDFSVILPANVARRFHRRPDRFFSNRHIVVTGLVSNWEGKPEMLIRRRDQVEIY